MINVMSKLFNANTDKHKNKMKKILYILSVVTILAGFVWSCSDDDEDQLFRLQLDNTDVTITSITSPVLLTIISGNEGYTVSSSDESIVTASISGTTVTLTAVGEGTTRVMVADKEKRSVAVSVTVSLTMPDSEFFIWNGATTEFDKPDGHGISILSSSIALTDLISEDKNQIVLSWGGGFTTGNKTNGNLSFVTSEGSETTTLTSVNVVRSDASGNYIVFSDGSKSGELFFIK